MSIELKPIKQLPKAKRGKTTEYENVLKQFMQGDDKFCEVSKKGVKGISLASALKQKIASNKDLKGKIVVHSRKLDGEVKVFLEKK